MSKQIGGDHYVRCSIQPWEIIERNELNFWEGNIVKYVLRHRMKDGKRDLEKARHYLEYLINQYERKENVQANTSERKFPQAPAEVVPELRRGSTGNSEVSPYSFPWSASQHPCAPSSY